MKGPKNVFLGQTFFFLLSSYVPRHKVLIANMSQDNGYFARFLEIKRSLFDYWKHLYQRNMVGGADIDEVGRHSLLR